VKAPGNTTVPLAVVTASVNGPPGACAGVVALNDVLLDRVMVRAAPPSVALVMVDGNEPLTVMTVPPMEAPDDGLTPATEAAAATV
jgi:hypothetical protein